MRRNQSRSGAAKGTLLLALPLVFRISHASSDRVYCAPGFNSDAVYVYDGHGNQVGQFEVTATSPSHKASCFGTIATDNDGSIYIGSDLHDVALGASYSGTRNCGQICTERWPVAASSRCISSVRRRERWPQTPFVFVQRELRVSPFQLRSVTAEPFPCPSQQRGMIGRSQSIIHDSSRP